MRLRLRDRVLDLSGKPPLIMGIVNVNDDSTASSVPLHTLDEQLEYALALCGDGADIIDVGAESGRTDRPPRSAAEESGLVTPLVEELARRDVLVSVDTFKPEVAEAAVDAGAALINDVSGLAHVGLADVAARSGAGLVLMHTAAAPKEEHFPGYQDPMADVLAFLRRRMIVARDRGVGDEQIVLDPGPDFAKTPQETVDVLRRLPELQALGRPVLLAVSRKYFIGAITGREPEDRLAGTLAAVGAGVDAGAAIVRVHDVADTRDYLELRRVLSDEGEVPLRGDLEDERLKWLPAPSDE
ncbi:MAG TPA: dihydropteroate synthase [Thermoleophilaceae bacterium]